jgi:hypothetical protein
MTLSATRFRHDYSRLPAARSPPDRDLQLIASEIAHRALRSGAVKRIIFLSREVRSDAIGARIALLWSGAGLMRLQPRGRLNRLEPATSGVTRRRANAAGRFLSGALFVNCRSRPPNTTPTRHWVHNPKTSPAFALRILPTLPDSEVRVVAPSGTSMAPASRPTGVAGK